MISNHANSVADFVSLHIALQSVYSQAVFMIQMHVCGQHECVVDKHVSKPFKRRSNWIQHVGHFCHRQEHYTDGKLFP